MLEMMDANSGDRWERYMEQRRLLFLKHCRSISSMTSVGRQVGPGEKLWHLVTSSGGVREPIRAG